MRISWKLIILMLLGVVLLATSAYKLRQWHQYRHTSEGLAKGFKAYEYSARRVPLEDNGWKILATVLVWSAATVLEIKRIRGTIRSLPLGEAMSRILPQWHIAFSTMIVVCTKRILRRWRIVFATMIIVCTVGVPAVWLLTPPEFRTKATIRVSLVPPSDSESARNIPDLDSLLRRAVHRLSSRRIIGSVAKELASENLSFFADSPILSEVEVLRNAVADEAINFIPEPSKELLTVEMISSHSDEAEVIIDAFIDSYMRSIRTAQQMAISGMIKSLLDKKQSLESEIEGCKQKINRSVEEFGSESSEKHHLERYFNLWGFHRFMDPNDSDQYRFIYPYYRSDSFIEMVLEVITRLQQDFIEVSIQWRTFDAENQTIEGGIEHCFPQAEKLMLKNTFVHIDYEVRSLLKVISEYDNEINLEKQKQLQENAKLQDLGDTLNFLETRLEARKKKLAEHFDAKCQKEAEKWKSLSIAGRDATRTRILERAGDLLAQISTMNFKDVDLGLRQLQFDLIKASPNSSKALNTEDIREYLARIKSLYRQVSNRIEEIRREQQLQPRISIAQMASSVPLRGGKLRMSIWVVPLGFVLGFVFAAVLEIKRSKATWR